MIDLRFKELPHALVTSEGVFSIKTDFRVWIQFDYVLREQQKAWYGIFDKEIPTGKDWVDAAIEFYQSKNETPKGSSGSNERAYDLVLDGDYIVASFWQAYGIDLTSIDYLHWHTFKALLIGLPDDTKLAQIMGYRLWHKENKKHDAKMDEMKNAWSLPKVTDKERKELLDWANKKLG